MSTAVMSSIPAPPSVRKSSRWGKIFKNKKSEEFPTSATTSHKRNPSVATTSSFRTNFSRASSMQSTTSRRTNKFFGSSNPVDDATPATVPIARQPYVPRNAANAFLKTTSPSAQKVQENLDQVTRRLSETTLSEAAPSRRDSVATTLIPAMAAPTAPENFGFYSMCGVCDIVEEEPEHEQRIDSPARSLFERADSATGEEQLPETLKSGDVVVREIAVWNAV